MPAFSLALITLGTDGAIISTFTVSFVTLRTNTIYLNVANAMTLVANSPRTVTNSVVFGFMG